MKELSIEEKARAYDEALRVLHKYDGANIMFSQSLKEEMFPELKESEGELVIAALKSGINGLLKKEYHLKGIGGISFDRIITWLEKQGEQKFEMKSAEESLGVDSETYNKIVDECIYGEQKPADKVEPKFKVGDWIVSNVSHEDYRICKILNIENGEYVIESIYGYQGHNKFETFDKDYHLWSTQDAKDGDVLANKSGAIFINAGSSNRGGTLDCYCYLSVQNEFCIEEHKTGSWFYKDDIKPATKEQRRLLFQKMTEAGYEWDTEKQELRKIEQKQSFDIEIPFGAKDSELQEVTYYIPKGFHAEINGDKVVIKKGEKPITWSEEDDYVIERLFCLLDNEQDNYPQLSCEFQEIQEIIEWLKSVKDRVQPKQDKQKLADERKPKFTVGDWIVYNRNDHLRELLQIYDIRDGRYYFTDNVHLSWSIKECDEKSHLWTIQDAKAGDILVTTRDKAPFIFKGFLDKSHPEAPVAYGGITCDNSFDISSFDNWWDEGEMLPANKEQRNFLFKKMKEAGYTPADVGLEKLGEAWDR